jgi:hypothetical protein
MPYLPFVLLLAERIDAQDLAEDRLEVLRVVVGIAAAAAVGGADVEQAELGSARPRQRIEGDLSAVVIGERMRDAEQLARRAAVIRRRLRILRGPLEQDLVVRAAVAARV